MSSYEARLTITREGAGLTARLALPGRTAQDALGAFTEPESLRKWWPGELTADLRRGGAYRVHFAPLGQTMTGVVEAYVPDERLVFTWGWAHELELAGRYQVAVSVHDQPDGTVLELQHGPRPGAELTPREGEVEGHLEGWEYFLPRLALAV
ncbi:SRPBCC domain-containing protein [Actinospica durhamensis]|uniref:SRPBCC domain-containing protein n=1 Tax=Actinospica durhamensis TaxID=1508375 RepID=A0A941ETZ5_9ACTN|nr:SRPBCC family protein [Actinospica durhamensis]MBR7837203.1 SRPBCC domain-containing protein [Actinospica durhamensis]